jgi:chemotaxis protein histidine kinase CheA
MDIETIEALHNLRGELRHIEARLTTRVDRLDESGDRRFEEVRRHFDVIAESLRDDIRMIAEGVVSLSARVDTFRR